LSFLQDLKNESVERVENSKSRFFHALNSFGEKVIFGLFVAQYRTFPVGRQYIQPAFQSIFAMQFKLTLFFFLVFSSFLSAQVDLDVRTYEAHANTPLSDVVVGLAGLSIFRKIRRLPGAGTIAIWLLFSAGVLNAQGPFDGYLKGKRKLDIAPSFSNNSSKKYQGAQGQIYDIGYRGSLLSIFAEYGLTENLDLIGMGSYIFTPTQDGLQDGGLFAKYRFWKTNPNGKYRLHALFGSGLGFPLSDYESTANGALGTKAIAVPASLILQLETPSGFFVNLTSGYNWRLDRASEADIAAVRKQRPDYQPPVPANYATFLIKIGFPAAWYYLDAWFEWRNTQGGADYLPDVPDLPQMYGVSYRQIGGTAYYSENRKTGFYVSSGYILGGRNVSRIFRITGGLVFKINSSDQ